MAAASSADVAKLFSEFDATDMPQRMGTRRRQLFSYRGLYLAGAAYHGIGIPDCIRDGTETAERVLRDLGLVSA